MITKAKGYKMTRALSKKFFNEFYSGKYKPLKELINAEGAFKSRFMFNLRGNQVMVYCKGHRAVIIEEGKNDLTLTGAFYTKELQAFIETELGLETKIDEIKKNEGDDKLYKKLVLIKSVKFGEAEWKKFLSLVADGIEAIETSQEKDAQQRIWYENNVSNIANTSDYVIIDTEYDTPKSGRFDLVALHWDDHNKKPGLAIIELKYSNCSVGTSQGPTIIKEKTGEIKNTTAICGHWNGFHDYDLIKKSSRENSEELKDFTKMFWQLFALKMYNPDRTIDKGLLDTYCPNGNPDGDWETTNWDNMENMIDIERPIMFIFALANYNMASTGITTQIKEIKKIEAENKDNSKNYELRFGISTFLGYGLFDAGMLNLKQAKKFISVFRRKTNYWKRKINRKK